MTICIGAICENKFVVLATDRMITVLQPNIEFEQEGITKAIKITDNCFAVTAGSAVAFNEIMREAQPHLAMTDVAAIAECIRNAYINCRKVKVEEQILLPIGLSVQAFWQNNQAMQPSIAAHVLQAMQEYNYGLWVLIAGVDESGAHLWHIENPGTMICLDNIGFQAVGSGQDHALSSFIANDFDPTIDLSHGLAIAFEAKKRSEKATGVGGLTDIVIINKENYKRLNDEELVKLDEIYSKRVEIEKTIISELDDLISELDFLPET